VREGLGMGAKTGIKSLKRKLSLSHLLKDVS